MKCATGICCFGWAIMMSRARLLQGFLFKFHYGRQRLGAISLSHVQSLHCSPSRDYGLDCSKTARFGSTWLDQQRRSLSLLMSSVDEDEATDTQKSIDGTWNLPGLKKEVQRLALRCHKKVGKASQRLQKAQETTDELATNPDATLEELENCPNVEAMEMELSELKDRLRSLNRLGESLAGVKGKSDVVLPEDVAQLALDLGVEDKAPRQAPRGPKKKKGPRQMSKRLPYRRYYTEDRVEIRVGKQAEDNDELSLSPEHRDGTDWWMHASGCPGSHVVIRSGDADPSEEVVLDAAALAARQSKCQGRVIKVSLTRCRDVTKPPGAKAGLVQLAGNVRTITVNIKEAQVRLDRLDATVLVN